TQTFVCSAGNPGMATGGMGDVLSGVIGALLAQKLPLLRAASLGVLLHSCAADICATEKGEIGLLASDLLDKIRQLLNAD
ncbi:TPA: bifunctional ADP-dependent NAD(P)H-hydrate dehydratase/NAD(P)H-hydrate epimerase, partial [Vibrio vulnificus]|nr:bifunctional ADP-dependent NAD(P)H-hydrate dehydratase/NAD(P)H-hydrate epimerase [Vibrio vulnificus]